MANRKSSIGFDPLAWMKGERRESTVPKTVGSRETKKGDRESEVSKAAGSQAADVRSRGSVSPPRSADSRPATPDSRLIALGDSLTIGEVKARHADWKTRLANAKAIEIDGAKLGKIDTAALQLLVALVQDARARNIPVKWRAPSSTLREGAARLGLASILNLA